MPVPRNPYAWHPLLRKGGAHRQSRSGQRAQARQSLQDEVAAYLELNEEEVIERVAQEGDPDSR